MTRLFSGCLRFWCVHILGLHIIKSEQFCQIGQDVEEELVSANEVDCYDTYAMSLVNGDALGREEVDDSDESGVHQHSGEEEGGGREHHQGH